MDEYIALFFRWFIPVVFFDQQVLGNGKYTNLGVFDSYIYHILVLVNTLLIHDQLYSVI
jgi:hypothetical protein